MLEALVRDGFEVIRKEEMIALLDTGPAIRRCSTS